jgi:phosphotransferase system, enzyme I, PtsP
MPSCASSRRSPATAAHVAVDQCRAGLVDLPHLADSGADGIGLFRTELQFMMARSFPRLDQQAAHYRAVLDAAGDKPVVFRSLDIGSDKVLPYLHRPREENPAMGWRAMRMALDRKGLLRLQVRALLTAARGRELKLMFPMIAEVGEFLQGREVVEKEKQRLQRLGHELPSAIKLGAMIEVPSIVWQLDRLLEVVRLRLDRIERPDAVPVRLRPRPSPARRSLSIR